MLRGDSTPLRQKNNKNRDEVKLRDGCGKQLTATIAITELILARVLSSTEAQVPPPPPQQEQEQEQTVLTRSPR